MIANSHRDEPCADVECHPEDLSSLVVSCVKAVQLPSHSLASPLVYLGGAYLLSCRDLPVLSGRRMRFFSGPLAGPFAGLRCLPNAVARKWSTFSLSTSPNWRSTATSMRRPTSSLTGRNSS